MLTFAVVASRTGHPVTGPALDVLRDRACPAVPFTASAHLVWSNDCGTVWFAGWQDREEPGEHWHVDEGGLTAVAGRAWPRLEGWPTTRPLAEQLAAWLVDHPLTGGTDDLSGVFVAASLSADGPAVVAPDPVGIGLAHHSSDGRLMVVTTRAALAAALIGATRGTPVPRDPLGAGWLAYSVDAMGTDTGFGGVQVLPHGARVEAGPTGQPALVQPTVPAWWRRSEELGADPEAALDEARTEMVTSLRTALAGGACTAGLTGGRDSRLVLALLLSEGLADEVEFQTVGPPDLPDVIIASKLAHDLGLRHNLNPGMAERWEQRARVDATINQGRSRPLSWREITFRLTGWASGGMRPVAQPMLGRPPAPGPPLLSGIFGEVLRTNTPASRRFQSKLDALANVFIDARFGSATILRDEVRASYEQRAQALFLDGARASHSPQDMVDAMYLTQRMRRWLGTALEIDSDNRVLPLYSITAMQLAFAIGAENRHREWIHHRLIERAGATLATAPYTGAGPPPTSGPELLTRKRWSDPVPAGPVVLAPPRPDGPAKNRALMRELRDRAAGEDLAIMRHHLLADPSSPVLEIIDRSATEAALDRFDELGSRGRQQLYGALSAALWLGERELEWPRGLTP